MTSRVMYHSMTGNTKKIAKAIAGALGISAEPITKHAAINEPVDFLFIGDGTYFAKMNKKTKAFIDTLDGSMVKNTIVFGTFGDKQEAIAEMKASLKERGIQTSGEIFSCKGQTFLLANRNHPDENDLNEAREFARRITGATENK